MAARDLSRTVVEGGRHRQCQWERRLLRRRERRMVCDDDAALSPPLPSSGRYFADRLTPLERWLASHAGRGWNNVYSEFCERFDQRTMKGWHLKDHLLWMVGLGPRRYGGSRFHVDARGILRDRGRARWSPRPTWVGEVRADSWAAGRRVIVHGEAFFWTARVVDPAHERRRFSPQGVRLNEEEVAFWLALSEGVRLSLTYALTRPRA